MQILIISGFLGAGKTSFIQAMAKATGRQYVIVENEFSAFNIDGPLLEAMKGEADNPFANLEVRELSEGCICCSSKQDFASTVLTIANTLNPDFLLVEPSGVAFPGRIVEDLSKICYEHIGILEPITIIDGQHYHQSRRAFPEYMSDQILTGRHIVVSKSEHFSADDFQRIREDLNIDESTHMPLSHYSRWNEADWLSLFTKLDGTAAFCREDDGRFADEDLSNVGVEPFTYRNPAQLVTLLHELTTGRYGYIVRAKGYFEGDGGWFRFDYVEGQYAITGCTPMGQSRAVVIGKGLDRAGLRRLLKRFEPKRRIKVKIR